MFGNFGFDAGGGRKRQNRSLSSSNYNAASGDPAYDKWAADTAREFGSTSRTLINPEQYKVWQLRNANLDAALRGANTNMTAAGQAAASVADPWATQRPLYQPTLRELVQSPGTAMQQNPFFKWQQQQGEQAVNRAAAAQGQLGSGNRMTALSDYAQKQSGQQYFQLADLLSLLSGAKNQNPAAAAQMMLTGALADQRGKDFQYGGGRTVTDIDMRGFRPGYFV